MVDDFYREFEDRYRGPRELIKERLLAYLPFIEPLVLYYPESSAIDLGCGRGEWLEVLDSAGLKPIGVDSDEGMLKACVAAGLDATQTDAISHLSSLPDESQVVVSAFHVVEHINFRELRTLVAEALRVLKPGGLLILETPNPENIFVATRDFYNDPTHQKPIPPLLLSFIPEYYGFSRVKVVRLQESRELLHKSRVALFDVLGGASPDYSVVAQKQGDDALMRSFNSCFAHDFGLTLDVLATRYDEQFFSAFGHLESLVRQEVVCLREAEAARIQASNEHIQQAHTLAQELNSRAVEAEARAQESNTQFQQMHVLAQELNSRAVQAEARAQESSAYLQQAHALAQELNGRTVQAEMHLFDAQRELLTRAVEISQTATDLKELECRAGGYLEQLAQLDHSLADMATRNHHHWMLAEQRAAELVAMNSQFAQIQEQLFSSSQSCIEAQSRLARKQYEVDYWHGRVLQLHASKSWRITAPLRAIKRLLLAELSSTVLETNKQSFSFRVRHHVRTGIAHGIRYVFLRPGLRNCLSRILKCLPWLHRRLLYVGFNAHAIDDRGLVIHNQPLEINPAPEQQYSTAAPVMEAANLSSAPSAAVTINMTPCARDVYSDLESAIKRVKVEGV